MLKIEMTFPDGSREEVRHKPGRQLIESLRKARVSIDAFNIHHSDNGKPGRTIQPRERIFQNLKLVVVKKQS